MRESSPPRAPMPGPAGPTAMDAATDDPGLHVDAYLKALRSGDAMAARAALRAYRQSEHGQDLLQDIREQAQQHRDAHADGWQHAPQAQATPPLAAIPAWIQSATPADVAQMANTHPLFAQALEQLHRLGPLAGGNHDTQDLQRVAGALALESSSQQLDGIHALVRSDDGHTLIASWQNPGNAADVRHASIDVQAALQANRQLQQQLLAADAHLLHEQHARQRDEQQRTASGPGLLA